MLFPPSVALKSKKGIGSHRVLWGLLNGISGNPSFLVTIQYWSQLKHMLISSEMLRHCLQEFTEQGLFLQLTK